MRVAHDGAIRSVVFFESMGTQRTMTAIVVKPPVARKEATPTYLHGQTLEDDYRWMRQKESPEVIAYLEAENAYTAAAMAGTEELQERSTRRCCRTSRRRMSRSPIRDRGWFYYTRTMEGSQYPIYCRRKRDRAAVCRNSQPEEVLLDVNQLAEGQPFMSVGGMSVSPDGDAAGLFDRQHRLPAVHAAHPKSGDGAKTSRDASSGRDRSCGRRTRRRSSTRQRMR